MTKRLFKNLEIELPLELVFSKTISEIAGSNVIVSLNNSAASFNAGIFEKSRKLIRGYLK
jgi:hypothetical protein